MKLFSTFVFCTFFFLHMLKLLSNHIRGSFCVKLEICPMTSGSTLQKSCLAVSARTITWVLISANQLPRLQHNADTSKQLANQLAACWLHAEPDTCASCDWITSCWNFAVCMIAESPECGGAAPGLLWSPEWLHSTGSAPYSGYYGVCSLRVDWRELRCCRGVLGPHCPATARHLSIPRNNDGQ